MGAGIRSLVKAATMALLLAGALAVPGEARAPGGGAGRRRGPATFEVLHDDSVGELILARGAYTVTLLDPSALTCADAADLFRQFLEDFDGRLPRPWVVNAGTQLHPRERGLGRFQRHSGRTGGGGGGGGGHHRRDRVSGNIPGAPQRPHRDVRVPKGQYVISLLAVGRITCAGPRPP